jgi:hypothetical protein
MNKATKFILVFALLLIAGLTKNPCDNVSNEKLLSFHTNKGLELNLSNLEQDNSVKNTDAEIAFHQTSSLQARYSKNPVSKLFVLVKFWNQKLQTNYNQYNFYSQKLLVTFASTDIFYPFHHFW